MSNPWNSKQAARRRSYREAQKAKARHATNAVGVECPVCRVLGPHPVYRVGKVLEVECGSDWCGIEFQIVRSA